MSVKYVVLFVMLLLFGMSAKAGMVARDAAGNVLFLHDERCVSSPWLKEWKTATFQYEGKTYAACWREQGGTIFVIDAAGDVTPVPPGMFKRETGV
jgi:hypothetical protein